MQFASFGVSLRALSGASRDASEEVFVFRPIDVWKGERKGINENGSDRNVAVPSRHSLQDDFWGVVFGWYCILPKDQGRRLLYNVEF